MDVDTEDPPDVLTSFDELARVERPRLEATAWAILGDRHLAQDIAQNALATGFQRWDKIRRFESPGGWLHRVAVNEALSRRRRIGAEARALTRMGPRRQVEDRSETTTEALWVWGAVRTLPRNQAVAIALHYLGGLSVTEIASITGRAPGTVMSDLHRGRERLRKRLGAKELP